MATHLVFFGDHAQLGKEPQQRILHPPGIDELVAAGVLVRGAAGGGHAKDRVGGEPLGDGLVGPGAPLERRCGNR